MDRRVSSISRTFSGAMDLSGGAGDIMVVLAQRPSSLVAVEWSGFPWDGLDRLRDVVVKALLDNALSVCSIGRAVPGSMVPTGES